jgi:molybdate transport system regulatory protein
MTGNQTVGARLRVVIAPGIGIGPGKVAMLEGVRETGSIAAAGRRIGMSYKRAWLLVAALNGHFDEPLIEASKGGKTGGGAHLTPLGEEVLDAYRGMLARTNAAITPTLKRLAKRIAPPSPPPSQPSPPTEPPGRGRSRRTASG